MASNVANYGETNPVYELGFRDVVMPTVHGPQGFRSGVETRPKQSTLISGHREIIDTTTKSSPAVYASTKAADAGMLISPHCGRFDEFIFLPIKTLSTPPTTQYFLLCSVVVRRYSYLVVHDHPNSIHLEPLCYTALRNVGFENLSGYHPLRIPILAGFWNVVCHLTSVLLIDLASKLLHYTPTRSPRPSLLGGTHGRQIEASWMPELLLSLFSAESFNQVLLCAKGFVYLPLANFLFTDLPLEWCHFQGIILWLTSSHDRPCNCFEAACGSLTPGPLRSSYPSAASKLWDTQPCDRSGYVQEELTVGQSLALARLAGMASSADTEVSVEVSMSIRQIRPC
ncbi:hypothetical protein An13g00830 [Aspergillus niger]|uniref:Uncharacterized protein n=2 Tax=Aspergillus niger TaxID=5061 RepID=A2R1D5_ASPNC|nr:hypothetical protein An13g00830 [Aspergillus niger]CAK41485.1 hypothetical protein An13g00830 [Aspergillus niger]